MTEPDTREYYSITSTCKDDMLHVLRERSKEINQLNNAQMKYIAEKLCDDYCEQLYWDSLESILESTLDSIKAEKKAEKKKQKQIEARKRDDARFSKVERLDTPFYYGDKK